jgi:mono/diheme cytochrome c family protein
MNRRGTRATIVIAFVSAVGLAAAAGGRAQNASGATLAPARLTMQETKERMYIGREDQIRAGEKLFRQHCAECHGTNGRGVGKAANLQAPHVQAKSPAELVEFLRNGNLWAGMPSWAGMPEQRRWQIVAYIKTLRQ